MSATSTLSPVAPHETRDIRSTSVDSKRSKDHNTKWVNGVRPLHGIRVNYMSPAIPSTESHQFEGELAGGDEVSRTKLRPAKQWPSEPKTHANRSPRTSGVDSYVHGKASSRLSSKCDAIVDAKEHTGENLSRSLLELLPQHSNNTNSAIQTALRDSEDAEILYSFDNRGPSPGAKGREVDLGGLVDSAEKKWVSAQTDKIVKGEYEVLDLEGEPTVIKSGKKRSPKNSPKQKAQVVAKVVDAEDEDYELV
jgi:hypothetical protein